MSYAGKMLKDSICDPPVMEIPARKLLGTVCVCGGADCPLFQNREEAETILARVKSDPTVTIRLVSNADRIPHYSMLEESDYVNLDREDMLNRKRDLAVLQRLGLCPGDTRRARWLYELLLARIETPVGICAFDTPKWEGCPLVRSGAYEVARTAGSREIVFDCTEADRAEARRLSAKRIRNNSVIKIRPHHLMCMSCWIGTTGGEGIRDNDTLDVVWKRIRRDPHLEIKLVEGNCEACHCCDGFHAESTRCVHPCGLIRDYLKDLDVFQKLGLLPGAQINARELLMLIYQRIESTTDICGYGSGEATAQEWTVCGGPEGSVGYAKARKMVQF